MIDKKNVFDQPVKSNMRVYDNIWKISTDQGDDYTTGCLQDYYFKYHYKLIAIHLSKQKALYADPKTIQQISFQGNAAWDGNKSTTIFSLLKKQRNHLDFTQKPVRVL